MCKGNIVTVGGRIVKASVLSTPDRYYIAQVHQLKPLMCCQLVYKLLTCSALTDLRQPYRYSGHHLESVHYNYI